MTPDPFPFLPHWGVPVDAGIDRVTASAPPRHVHLVPSLALGGAERIALDVCAEAVRQGGSADLIVLHAAPVEHPIPATVAVHRLDALAPAERMAAAAAIIRASGLPAYAHLTRADELQALWQHGVATVPVVHNAAAGWRQDPRGWTAGLVPFAAACGEAVANDLRAAVPDLPVRVLRHVVGPQPGLAGDRRSAVRAALGAGPSELLLGMVGRFARQKNHGRAVGVLAALQAVRPARLAIVGAASDAEGAACREETALAAIRLGVRDRLVMVGPVAQAGALVGAFDALLVTSDHEGVSIATMEAVAAGVPVVSTDVGGQREAIGPGDRLVPAGAGPATWVEAVLAATAAPRLPLPAESRARLSAAAAIRWPWLLALGPGSGRPPGAGPRLFVTGNMNVGGAQRSLCNLAAELARCGEPPLVAIAGPIGVPGFMQAAREAGARFIDVSGAGGLAGRAGRILALAARERPSSLAFWNMDPETKAVVAQVMAGGPCRIVDVSPGPALFRELAASHGVRLLGSPSAYLGDLDHLVSKYHPPPGDGSHDGGGTSDAAVVAGALPPVAVIPNGVPPPADPLPPDEGPSPPPGSDPTRAVVVVGRLVEQKMARLLPAIARRLAEAAPGATITVVGGAHGTREVQEFEAMLAAAGGRLPDTLVLVGPDHRTQGFIRRFAVLLMLSVDQGCPNTSLEALSCGVPVVANDDGGTRAQVIDGVTGRLLRAAAPDDLVADAVRALAGLVLDPGLAARLGEAGRQHVLGHFTMTGMRDAYRRVLDGEP